MAGYPLALAVNGREYQLSNRLVAFSGNGDSSSDQVGPRRALSVAIVGLGYVGLPTAYELHSRGVSVTGVDTSEARLREVRSGQVDLPDRNRRELRSAVADGAFRLANDFSPIADADAVIICVPTPVGPDHVPDLSALRDACTDVAEHVRAGQTVLLTSTSYVGTTRELLIEPLTRRGWAVGRDLHVAFSAERIDPGNPDHRQHGTPRVVGGATQRCSEEAARVIENLTESVFLVTSPEAAELTKLYENVFRAVTLALANEFADVSRRFGLDPIEVTLAAGTKPYGFLAGFPGPGVGGHCIPCDPHYLLWQLGHDSGAAPLLERTMRSIDERPLTVVRRILQVLAEDGRDPRRCRVLVVGASYKAGVSDLRESPALTILSGLAERGVRIGYHDPLIPTLRLADGTELSSEDQPDQANWDLALIHTVHPGYDYGRIADWPSVLDATYQFDLAPHRRVV